MQSHILVKHDRTELLREISSFSELIYRKGSSKMKFRKSLTSYMAFGLAVFFTVGSMYTTVDAASQDESQVPPAPLEFGDVSPATATGLIAPLAPEPIDPGSVLHSRQQQITLDANGGFN